MRATFLAFLPLALVSCRAPDGAIVVPTPEEIIGQLLPVIEAFGDAAVRLHVTAVLSERAPALLTVLDVSGSETGGPDGSVSLDEIRGADWTSPALATVLVLSLDRLLHF